MKAIPYNLIKQRDTIHMGLS